MGMIAVMAVMLASMKRRLMGARELSSGITRLSLAGVVLLVVAGGASANGACIGITSGTVFGPGSTVTESCTFNESMTCPAGHGLIIGEDGITIDGNGFAIIGDRTACPNCGEGNPQAGHTGILNYNATLTRGHDDVVIKDLEIKNFCNGIVIKGAGQESWETPVDDNTIINCKVHDNGVTDVGSVTHGIYLFRTTNTDITKCDVYSNTGFNTDSCGTGGHGIKLYGSCEYCNITCNNMHDNRVAGLFAKYKCTNCRVENNHVYDNNAEGIVHGGGIIMRCMKTDDWTVRYNNVANNSGPGIFARSARALIQHNTVTGSKNVTGSWCGDGIQITNEATSTTVINNTFCSNAYYDIDDGGVSTTCESNTCDTSNGGAATCDWNCDSLVSVYYDYDEDGLYSGDTCNCGNLLSVGACCNPGSFATGGADEHCAGADGAYPSADDVCIHTTAPVNPDDNDCAPIPEMATIALVGLGLVGLVGYVRQSRRKD